MERRRWQTKASRIIAELERSECRELRLFSKLTWNLLWYKPVSIVGKLYQLHIVTVIELHSKNDYVIMTHFVEMTYCQDNKSMLLLHTSSYYNKVMLH